MYIFFTYPAYCLLDLVRLDLCVMISLLTLCGVSQVARKLAMVEADLERAEERAETGES